jgi:biopolymer transport protein ExbB/TolQ
VRTPDTCPHCAAETEFSDAAPGSVVDCPACDQSFVLPSSKSELAADSALPPGTMPRNVGLGPGGSEPMRLPDLAGVADSHSRDVSFTKTGLIAAGLTTAFYLVVVFPLSQTYFGELFGARGWVPYAVSYLAAWCGVLLIAKYARLRRRERVLNYDLLPRAIGEAITPVNVPQFLDYLSRLPGHFADDFLFQRIRRSLEHFQARANVAETVDQLRSHAERDEGIVESSYTMIRVFIWAIPILGFIGTVLGIGASVSGFSDAVSAAANLDVMKNAIGMVTSGLGVAFDTTLLALVMSIFIMVPTSSLQKTEEDYLARVDDYCQHYLVTRLEDGKLGGPGAPEEWVSAAADRLAKRVLEALDSRRPGSD